MPGKILNVPYEVERQITDCALETWRIVKNPHQDYGDRTETLRAALAHQWKLGYAAKESFGFRWGLVIGAATGGLIVCIANALGGAL